MDTNAVIKSIFAVERALIGVVHLQALPGTPSNRFYLNKIISMAVNEA